MANISTSEETPGVHISSREIFQTKTDYIPGMSGNQYETVNTQVECEDNLHKDVHMFFCQELIQEVPDAAASIMKQLYIKLGTKRLEGKIQTSDKYYMKQLHFRDIFKPNHYRELYENKKKSILESHMFLKKNRDGKIKGMTMEGGKKQRDFISKEDPSLPTEANKAVLLSCIIDPEEEGEVTVIDTPNESIQTLVENENGMAVINIRGVLVDFLLNIDP